jgi:hypothetical protein
MGAINVIGAAVNNFVGATAEARQEQLFRIL